ncbi:MAG: hypothetical protein ACXWHF_06030 [Chthoniobacterales bacterium]
MSTRVACIILALLLASTAAIQAGTPRATLRVHLQANENDSDVFATSARSAVTGKKIVMEKIPRISEQDVLSFYPYQGANGTYGVLFKLNEHGRLALDTMSVERRGAYVYVFVNGRPLSEMQIDKRITDGQLYLASGLTRADLALMGKSWPVTGRKKK